MRCSCCNRALSDAESTARHPDSALFLDTCFKCLKEIGISPVVRTDLEETEPPEWEQEEFDWEEDDDEE